MTLLIQRVRATACIYRKRILVYWYFDPLCFFASQTPYEGGYMGGLVYSPSEHAELRTLAVLMSIPACGQKGKNRKKWSEGKATQLPTSKGWMAGESPHSAISLNSTVGQPHNRRLVTFRWRGKPLGTTRLNSTVGQPT